MAGVGAAPMDWRQQPVEALQAPHLQQDERLLLLHQEHLRRQKAAALAAAGIAGSNGLPAPQQPQPQPQQQQVPLQQQAPLQQHAAGAGEADAAAQRVLQQRRALLQLRQQMAAAAAAQAAAPPGQARQLSLGTAATFPGLLPGGRSMSLAREGSLSSLAQAAALGAALGASPAAPAQLGPLLEVDADLLAREGDRVVSALSGGRRERAWALNALCLLSSCQEVKLGDTPELLAALLPVLQEGLAAAVGLSNGEQAGLAGEDEQREVAGLPPLPGWQGRRAQRACGALFPDRARLRERLEEAAAAACVLRNVAEVQQNSALLLDPPVMRCWIWALNAARELLLQQQAAEQGPPGGGAGPTGSGGGGGAAAPAASGPPGSGGEEEEGGWGQHQLPGLVVGSGPAADICTSLLQLTTVLSGRMLLPAFFECGSLLMRALLITLRPTWQQAAAAAGSAVLPPPLVSLAALAVTAVATAYQPNTDILLSLTVQPGVGPGAQLMQVVADLLVCPFDVFRQHAQQQVDEECPGWRHLLPTDAQLLAEARRAPKASTSARGGGDGGGGGGGAAAAEGDRSAAEQCTLDMLAVLSQLRYLSAMLTLLWRLLTAAEPAGAHARAAAAACPRLLATLCKIAVHRWPQHPVRWHAEGHTLRHADAYPAYLRFLSHDMMPTMRERQELLHPLRADAAALLALLAADPETRGSVAWCEAPLVTAVMSGTVSASEPGVSALITRFAVHSAAAAAAGVAAAGAGGTAGAAGAAAAAGGVAAGAGLAAAGGVGMTMQEAAPAAALSHMPPPGS